MAAITVLRKLYSISRLGKDACQMRIITEVFGWTNALARIMSNSGLADIVRSTDALLRAGVGQAGGHVWCDGRRPRINSQHSISRNAEIPNSSCVIGDRR